MNSIFLVATVAGVIYGFSKQASKIDFANNSQLLKHQRLDNSLKNNNLNNSGINENISNMFHPADSTRTSWSFKNFYDLIRDYVYPTGWSDGTKTSLPSVYNYKTGKLIRHFDVLPNSSATKGILIYSLSPDNDYIWVNTDTGIYALNVDALTGYDYVYSSFPSANIFPKNTSFVKSYLDTSATIGVACNTTSNNMQLIYAYQTSITGKSVKVKSLQAYCVDSWDYRDPTKMTKSINYDYKFPGFGTYVYRAYFTKYYLAISDLNQNAKY